MGRDKAWLELEGEPLLARAIRILRGLNPEEILISGRAGVDYSRFGCPVVVDLEPGLGPVAGIERVLREAQHSLVLVLAVDMPLMTAEFLGRLAASCDVVTGVVPRRDGELEPLAAIYPKCCHTLALKLMLQTPPARAFAEACLREHAVRLFRVRDRDLGCFENWNTPAAMG